MNTQENIAYLSHRFNESEIILDTALKSISSKIKTKTIYHWILRIISLCCFGMVVFLPIYTFVYFVIFREFPMLDMLASYSPEHKNDNDMFIVMAIFIIAVIILLLVGTALFRHDSKLIKETYNYSMIQYEIELYSSLLKAAKIGIEEFKYNEKSVVYIEELLSLIRERILSHSRTQLYLDTTPNNSGNNDSNGVLISVLKEIISSAKTM